MYISSPQWQLQPQLTWLSITFDTTRKSIPNIDQLERSPSSGIISNSDQIKHLVTRAIPFELISFPPDLNRFSLTSATVRLSIIDRNQIKLEFHVVSIGAKSYSSGWRTMRTIW